MSSTSKLKFVVLKGLGGFGDRLQCLLETIRYAKSTKRIIVIDWGDSNWSHEEEINSEYYFSINELDCFSFDSFKIYYKKLFHDLTVYPAIWKNQMLDNNYEEFIYKNIFSI